jgi:DNA modification methylase
MEDMISRGETVDTIITDPPYELETHGKGSNKIAQRKQKQNKDLFFVSNGFDYEKCFNLFLKICKIPNIILFCSNKQLSKTMSWFENAGLSTTLLVWNKFNAIPACNNTYINDVEFIVYVRGKKAPYNNGAPINVKHKIKTYPYPHMTIREHPTQKPVELIKELVQLHSFAGQTVFDPFMGSGTTGIACMENNRNFIGVEREEKYFNIAKRRIEDSMKQIKMEFLNE